jgi:hypothetical protein
VTSPGVISVAVVLPLRGSLDGADLTIAALERQTVRPAVTVVVDPLRSGIQGPGSEPRIVGTLQEALQIGIELGDPWLWLLNRDVVPEPTALESLLSPLADMDPRPVLLASRVLTPDGRLDVAATPVPDSHRADRVLRALDQRCVAVRAARSGSLLVPGSALARVGVRSSSSLVHRDLEWTARLLGPSTGVLVPASVAIRRSEGRRLPPRSAYARIAGSIRMLAALDAKDDRVWFAVHLAERGLAAVRGWIRRYRVRSSGPG